MISVTTLLTVLRMAGPVENVPSLAPGSALGVVEVVPVGEPAEHGTDEGTDELTEQVGEHVVEAPTEVTRRRPRGRT